MPLMRCGLGGNQRTAIAVELTADAITFLGGAVGRPSDVRTDISSLNTPRPRLLYAATDIWYSSKYISPTSSWMTLYWKLVMFSKVCVESG